MKNREKYRKELLQALEKEPIDLVSFYNRYIAPCYKTPQYMRATTPQIIVAIAMWLEDDYKEESAND